ncbi:MAG: (2Fe-2S)-binding protein [Dehalobacterium sp.]
MQIQFTLNGKVHCIDVKPRKRLVDVLRDDLNLTGTKEGCGEGECGSCTVILDGQAVNSCLILAFQVRDKEIITIEGLAQNGDLDPLQKSFLEHGAVQCGYCTPGMLMSAKALLMKNPHPTEKEITDAIAGNICRCTGYNKIIAAIKNAAEDNYENKLD